MTRNTLKHFVSQLMFVIQNNNKKNYLTRYQDNSGARTFLKIHLTLDTTFRRMNSSTEI